MTWLTLGIVLLIAFLVAGCTVLVWTYLPKTGLHFRPPTENPYSGPYLKTQFGGAPPTPLPQWAHYGDSHTDEQR